MPLHITHPTEGAKDVPPSRPAPPTVPPRAKVGPSPKSAKPPVALASRKEIEKWFLKTYMMAAIAIGTVRPMTGNQIMESAPKCATANAELVYSDPRLRKAISQMMVVGKWGPVLASHLPIVLVAIAESRPVDPSMRFDQERLLGLANLLGDSDKITETLFGGVDSDSDVESG